MVSANPRSGATGEAALRRRVATAPERSPISLRSRANLAPERRVVVSLRSGFAPARLRCRSGAEGDAAPERSPISLRMATERAQSPLYQSQFNYFLAKQKRKEKKRLEGNEKMKSGLKGAVCKFSPIQNTHNSNLTSGFDPTTTPPHLPPPLHMGFDPTDLLTHHRTPCKACFVIQSRRSL